MDNKFVSVSGPAFDLFKVWVKEMEKRLENNETPKAKVQNMAIESTQKQAHEENRGPIVLIKAVKDFIHQCDPTVDPSSLPRDMNGFLSLLDTAINTLARAENIPYGAATIKLAKALPQVIPYLSARG